MKDIPIFTGCDGIATLILNQIPYRGAAFVLVRSVFTTTEACLRECESFCRVAGAQQVYFGGNADFSSYPIYAKLIERSLHRSHLPNSEAVAIPAADPDTWITQYNERFQAVPAAQYCRKAENAFDIFLHGTLIGIGQVEGSIIRSVATLKKGCGIDCLCALASLCDSDDISLLCAEQNLPAMRLYDRLGFSCGAAKEIWYCKKTLAI